MPFPRSQLDIVIASSLEDSVLLDEQLMLVRLEWEQKGLLHQGLLTSLGLNYLNVGQRVKVRFESSDKYRLYANHQGGYRVYCPYCNANCTELFIRVVGEWRRSFESPDVFPVVCHECAGDSNLMQMVGRPRMTFSKGGMVLSDVNSADVATDALDYLTQVLGPINVVLRRVG